MTDVALLELDQLSLAFGGLRALGDLDLTVDENEIVSVIGPNGAGKTSLFNVITGVYSPTAGDVRFAGRSIAGLRPDRITRLLLLGAILIVVMAWRPSGLLGARRVEIV